MAPCSEDGGTYIPTPNTLDSLVGVDNGQVFVGGGFPIASSFLSMPHSSMWDSALPVSTDTPIMQEDWNLFVESIDGILAGTSDHQDFYAS
ncbi:hypothetical protein V5O48_009486 [Marasmius crinis-equi]|uniref:Uncharacterized protein n=1 Tax=Marasmius crinis-equi TaxID=585013 RepID=A0ABR3FAZ8_9AGAR